MSYQGKLPLYVGTPADGNPMIDAEDAKFSFDPKGDRIRISCKVAAIMVKAACLHLGLPPPDRGPRRFILKATIRRESLLKHRDRLFDANLEVRLTAQEEGRPVLLDLTQFESFEVSPEA
jgi:hypothetical protein